MHVCVRGGTCLHMRIVYSILEGKPNHAHMRTYNNVETRCFKAAIDVFVLCKGVYV